MRSTFYFIRNPTVRNAFLTLLAILIMLSSTPAMVLADSLTVEMNKMPPNYNIGDSVSMAGTATPNASVFIRIFDPSNTIKVESEVQVASDGNYSVLYIYTIKVTDLPGTWRVNIYDLSSNETAEAIINVVALWERLKILEDQLIVFQNKIQTLNGTVETLETSVKDLSSRLSTIEASSRIAYGAIAISVLSAALSIVAITQYLQKRNIYNRLTGKTKKDKIRRY